MASYVSRTAKSKPVKEGHLKVNIEFLGLWDIVSALGFPQLPLLDSLVNLVRRHKFYDYEPTETFKHAFHAVGIDDERRTFWPMIWNETKIGDGQHIEQAWFPGVHSNVGGGYPRIGLANVTLDWMIARLEAHRKRQRPAMMIITSKTDEATGAAFPAGRYLSNLFETAQTEIAKKDQKKQFCIRSDIWIGIVPTSSDFSLKRKVI